MEIPTDQDMDYLIGHVWCCQNGATRLVCLYVCMCISNTQQRERHTHKPEDQKQHRSLFKTQLKGKQEKLVKLNQARGRENKRRKGEVYPNVTRQSINKRETKCGTMCWSKVVKRKLNQRGHKWRRRERISDRCKPKTAFKQKKKKHFYQL